MMWPSQNFLLYDGTIIKIKVNEWVNNYKKYVSSATLPLGIYTTSTNYSNSISKMSERFQYQ